MRLNMQALDSSPRGELNLAAAQRKKQSRHGILLSYPETIAQLYAARSIDRRMNMLFDLQTLFRILC
jgi:hypothetical protein